MIKILILDQDPTGVENIRKIADKNTFQIETVLSISETQRNIEEHAPDIIICEYEFLTGLMNEDPDFFTGDASKAALITIAPALNPETFRTALRAGCKEVVLAPLQPAELSAALDRVLHLSARAGSNSQPPAGDKLKIDLFSSLFDNNPMPMLIFEISTLKILAVNDAAIELYGHTRAEFLNLSLKNIRPPEDMPFLKKSVTELPQGLQKIQPVRHWTKTGEIIDVEIVTMPVNYQGTPARHVMIKNISDQQKALNALEVSEEKYRMLYETMAQGVIYQDRDGNVLSVNPAAKKILKSNSTDKNTLAGKEDQYSLNFDDGRIISFKSIPLLDEVKKGTGLKNVVSMAVNPRGVKVWLLLNSILKYPEASKTNYHVITTFDDITAVKQFEDNLRISEERNQAVLKAIPDQIFQFEFSGKIISCKNCESVGYKAEQLIGKNIRDIFPAEVSAPISSIIEHIWRTGEQQTFGFQLMVNSENRDFEARMVGGKEEVLALIRDITDRKRYEIDLQKSETKFRILLESASQAIVLVDMYGRISLVNTKVEQLFGYSREELIYQEIEILIPHIYRDRHKRHREGYLLKPTSREMGKGMELAALRKDGREFPVEISLSSVEIYEGFFVLALITDISERKNLENKIRQIEKLEAIGQLAGGIAHDFNNVLAGIIGLTELALRKLPDDHKAAENLKIVIKKSDSAAELVSKLLAFSRQQMIAPKKLFLNTVIKTNRKMLQRYLGKDINLNIELDKDLKYIFADETAMDQVITNLCINARDAMPDGGDLLIKTENVLLEETLNGSERNLKPGPYVKLSVSDTGMGMQREIQKHIFEPFFTTKEQGEGTGLGLSTVYGLVNQHNGLINFSSFLGEGTTFEMYFPAIDFNPVMPDVQKQAEIARGSETILLVDDEADILKTSRSTLEFFGYKVLVAFNGVNALSVFEKHKQSIEMVISDVIMPQMGGIELKLLIQQIKPEVKFLMISAMTSKIEHDVPVLQKPFLGDDLAKKVRDVLDGVE